MTVTAKHAAGLRDGRTLRSTIRGLAITRASAQRLAPILDRSRNGKWQITMARDAPFGRPAMSDLRGLIEAVEAGTFPTGEWDNIPETVAYEAFGGSLDAAVRCVGYLVPGWRWMAHGAGTATVALEGFVMEAERVPGNPARALLLAALRAKMAEDR